MACLQRCHFNCQELQLTAVTRDVSGAKQPPMTLPLNTGASWTSCPSDVLPVNDSLLTRPASAKAFCGETFSALVTSTWPCSPSKILSCGMCPDMVAPWTTTVANGAAVVHNRLLIRQDGDMPHIEPTRKPDRNSISRLSGKAYDWLDLGWDVGCQASRQMTPTWDPQKVSL